MARGYFQMGNRSIEDRRLYYSTRHVYAVMLAYRSKAGTVCKSLERLAALAHCSVSTVRQAVDQLMEHGYLRRIRRTRYSRFLGRMVNDTYRYQIDLDKLTEGGYTLIPRSLLERKVTHGTFVTGLQIYRLAGRKGRAYGSLRHVARCLDMAKATVCRAMAALRLTNQMVRLYCRKADRALAANTLYPTAWVRGGGSLFSLRGGLIFSRQVVTNKITEDFIWRGKNKGVPEFGNSYKNAGMLSLPRPPTMDALGGSLPS